MSIKITHTKTVNVRWDGQDWNIDVSEGSKWTWALTFEELDQVATTWRFGHGYKTYNDAFAATEIQVAKLEKSGHRVHWEIIEL